MRNRTIVFTMLVIVALYGVGAHFATYRMHDPHTSTSGLCALAWIFSSFAAILAGGIILVRLNDRSKPRSKLVGNLITRFFATLCFATVLLALLSAIVSMPDNGLDTQLDAIRFYTILVAGSAGFALAFWLLFALAVRDDRRGNYTRYRSQLGWRQRRVSR